MRASASGSIRASRSGSIHRSAIFGVLLEPMSVVAKACEYAERIGARAFFAPKIALVTGTGPIGLLAALLVRRRGLDTWVLGRRTEGIKPRLVEDLGAHTTPGPSPSLRRAGHRDGMHRRRAGGHRRDAQGRPERCHLPYRTVARRDAAGFRAPTR